MSNFSFVPLKPECAKVYLPEMYDILYTNMSKIAPTGNTYEEEKAMWTSCVQPVLEQGRRNIISIFKENDLAGYFQYCVNSETFKMDDIQFKPEYQGSGMFTELYSYLVKNIPAETKYTEAYADKKNLKSQAVLKHLGLEIIGENKNGISYHFRGKYRKLLERDMGKMDLLRVANFSTTTLSKLGKNQPVKLDMLMKICENLHCRIEDVVEFTEEEK